MFLSPPNTTYVLDDESHEERRGETGREGEAGVRGGGNGIEGRNVYDGGATFTGSEAV